MARLVQEHHKKEASLNCKIIELESSAKEDWSFNSNLESDIIEELKLKLKAYETEWLWLRESEEKVRLELNLLKSKNSEMNTKLTRNFDENNLKNFNPNKIEENNSSNSSEFEHKHSEVINNFNKLEKWDESANSAMSEDYNNIYDSKINNFNCKSKLSPENSKKNKYYKKYIQYKTLASELQTKIQETKDRAIRSLVEKEKGFMKQKQEWKIVENAYKRENEKLKKKIKEIKFCKNQNSGFGIEKKEFSTLMIDSKDDYLKDEIREIKAERENIVKKLNLDYQALLSKYEDDIGYYKEMAENPPRQSVDSIGPEFLQGQSMNLQNQIIKEMKENEEYYLVKQKELQEKIIELEKKIHEYEQNSERKEDNQISLSEALNNKCLIENLKSQIKSLEEEVGNLKKIWNTQEIQIEQFEKDLGLEEQKFYNLQEKYEILENKFIKSEKQLKIISSELNNEREQYKNSIMDMEKEWLNNKDNYEDTIHRLKINIKSKEAALLTMNEQLGEDDFRDLSETDPFAISSDAWMTDGSLFDELGESTGSSFSIMPKSFKSLAKRLTRRLGLVEERFEKIKKENSLLKDKNWELENRLKLLSMAGENPTQKINNLK